MTTYPLWWQHRLFSMFGLIFVLLWLWPPRLPAAPANDSYIVGYATAVLEREFQTSGEAISVQDGVITIHAAHLDGATQKRLLSALARIQGVTRVNLAQASVPTAQQTGAGQETVHDAQPRIMPTSESSFLPEGPLFEPLIADPRWPNFSAAYHYYIDDDELDHVAATNFGETFALYRDNAPIAGQWEIGIQAGVFAIFDMNSDSKDLVNADYFVGLPFSYRYRNFSALARLFHQSSHLGDEFLLRDRRDRINLTYESTDLKLSYKLFDLVRVYGGGGFLFDQEPTDLKPWTIQYGIEMESPWTYLGGAVRPIIATDFQHAEERDWDTNFSLHVGLQFENWKIAHRRLQIKFEYFSGRSPNGQFFRRSIKTIGLGAHLHF